MWTDEMNYLHETQMKKSGMQRTMRGIDSGSTYMEPLANHLSRVMTSCTIGGGDP
jgi:hypothetical protein